jgi:hypothetical protein
MILHAWEVTMADKREHQFKDSMPVRLHTKNDPVSVDFLIEMGLESGPLLDKELFFLKDSTRNRCPCKSVCINWLR